MNCRDFAGLCQLHIDHCLPPAERGEWERHLRQCDRCAALYRDMLALDEFLKEECRPVEAPADFLAGVMAALPADDMELVSARKRQQKPQRRLRWQRLVPIGLAAALLLTVLVQGLGPQDPGSEPPPGGLQVATQDPEDLPPLDEQPQTDPTPQPNSNQPVEPVDPQTPDQNPAANQPGDTVDPNATGSQTQNDPQPGTVTDPAQTTADDPPPTPDPGETEDPEEPQSNHLELPLPTSGLVTEGMFGLYLIASYADRDALAPSFNSSGNIIYYAQAGSIYQKWTAEATNQPVFLEEVKSVPKQSNDALLDESTVHGKPYYSAFSPNGRYHLVNTGDEGQGLYFRAVHSENVLSDPRQCSAAGGGNLLVWAPNSEKALFTDADGNLYAYYVSEDTVIEVFKGQVANAVWAKNSKTVVFEAGGEHGYQNIYYITLP